MNARQARRISERAIANADISECLKHIHERIAEQAKCGRFVAFDCSNLSQFELIKLERTLKKEGYSVYVTTQDKALISW